MFAASAAHVGTNQGPYFSNRQLRDDWS